MFDFSLAELLVVALAAILVVGPNEIPVVLRSGLKMFRSLKYWVSGVKHDIVSALDEDGELKNIASETTEQMAGGKRFILDDCGNYQEVFDISGFVSGKDEHKVKTTIISKDGETQEQIAAKQEVEQTIAAVKANE